MIPRIVSIIAGIWLMFAPWLLGTTDPAAGSDRTIGPLMVSFALMAVWEVLRPLRWVNFLLALYLIVVPWIWGFPMQASVNDMLVGVLVGAMSLIKGELTQPFDGGWRFVFFGKIPADSVGKKR